VIMRACDTARCVVGGVWLGGHQRAGVTNDGGTANPPSTLLLTYKEANHCQLEMSRLGVRGYKQDGYAGGM